MLFTTIAAGLLVSVALAAPTAVQVEARAASCAPTSYTLTGYTLTRAAGFATVDFDLKSTFADANGITDSVANGSHCAAAGTVIPNSNACNVPGRKVLFDLRAPQGQARYQITHTWVCNGQTWMSGNDVTVGPLECQGETCFAKPQSFAPQNVRMICSTPTC